MRDCVKALTLVGVVLFALGIVLASPGCGGGDREPESNAVSNATTNIQADRTGLEVAEGTDDTSGDSTDDVVEVAASEPAPSPILFPERAVLRPGDLGVQLVLLDPIGDATLSDRTRTVSWTVEPAGAAEIDEAGYLTPIGESGTIRVRAEIEGDVGEACDQSWSVTSEIVVEPTAGSGRPWDFAEDIVPVLTRAGCNAGGCHGRKEGQNGFKLSFYGYDPKADYRALTAEDDGSRVDLEDPEGSLMLGKATGLEPHGGGMRLDYDSHEYQQLVDWLDAGAPEQFGPTHGSIVDLALEPAWVILDEPGPLQIRAVATFEDGHRRDVTRWATYESRDDSLIEVDDRGASRLLRRGESDVVVRYRNWVATVRIASPIHPDLAFDFHTLPRANFIDERLYERLEQLRVPPSPHADDLTLLRRVSLDLTGHQPSPREIRDFVRDDDPEKFARLVDDLLDSSEFVHFWTIKLGDRLQVTSNRLGNGSAYLDLWLQRQVERNRPWDDLVTILLTAVGDPEQIQGGGPVNYALDDPDPTVRAERTAQRFLGLRLQCARCHDHPFDVWTQDDFYGLAAFFAKTGPMTPEEPAMAGMVPQLFVGVQPEGQVVHLRTEEPAVPVLLGGETLSEDYPDYLDPRIELARWMTAPENPYFARATVNWIWGQFFGRGLAEPVDDLSASNPPVHPELLDALADHLIACDYDLRVLIRTIVLSNAYAASSATRPENAGDNRFFSHQFPRPLTAHQIADALAQATGVPNRFPNKAVGTPAIEVHDPAVASTILDTFGRCDRRTGCSAVPTTPLSLRQSLLLIGGDVVDQKVAFINGYLANLLELEPMPDEVVENLYLRALCRYPSDEELSTWSAELEAADSFRDACEDLFWALLNSREFAFNH